MKHHRLPPLHLRLLAGAGVLLVLVLTVLAASPAAHAWAHGRADRCTSHEHPAATGDDDSGCAVVLFASSLEIPAEPDALVPPVSVAGGVLPVTAAEPLLSRPRYLRLPERGPPGPV